jgi:hypothetical protein
MAENTSFGITYDTSHVDDPYWMNPITWNYIKSNVRVLHLSAKPKDPLVLDIQDPSTHRPIVIREHCYLNYDDPAYDNIGFWKMVVASGWNRQVFIEYMPRYDEHLAPDIEELTKIWKQIKTKK